jgi:hypothetical protein
VVAQPIELRIPELEPRFRGPGPIQQGLQHAYVSKRKPAWKSKLQGSQTLKRNCS